jgi:hypothetical protein
LKRRPERLRRSPRSAASSQTSAASRNVFAVGARSLPWSSERFASARQDLASDLREKVR